MASCFQGGDYPLKPIKWYRELSTGKGRRKHGYFLLEGSRAVEQVVASHPDAVEELLIDPSAVDPFFSSGIPLRKISFVQLKTIASTVTPQGVIAVVRIPADSYSTLLPSDPGKRIVILENVQDPGNVGTMIRTAVAFGFSGMLLSRQCADPFAPKAVQSSAGAILIPWIRRGEDWIKNVGDLKTRGYRLYCADIHGATMVDFTTTDRFMIAFGNEGVGLSSSLLTHADCRFAIPMEPHSIESLNVAVSGGIILYTAFREGRW